jgi:hypothetical protein
MCCHGGSLWEHSGAPSAAIAGHRGARGPVPWLGRAERRGEARAEDRGASVPTPLAHRESVLAGSRNKGFHERICLNSLAPGRSPGAA